MKSQFYSFLISYYHILLTDLLKENKDREIEPFMQSKLVFANNAISFC